MERLTQAAEILSGVTASALSSADDDALVAATGSIERLGRMLDNLRVSAAAQIAQRSSRALGPAGLAASHGFRTAAEFVEHVTGVRAATARRWIRLGESLHPRVSDTGMPLPALYATTGDALALAEIGLDAAEAITAELSQASPRADTDRLKFAERELVAQASGGSTAGLEGAERGADGTGAGPELLNLPGDEPHPAPPVSDGPVPADLIRTQARVWRDFLDQDGVEPRAQAAREHRGIWVSRTPDEHGLHAIRGGLTPDVAAAVLAQFDTQLSPRRRVAFTEGDSPEAAPQDALDDDRTPDQKRHDVFAAMVRAFGASDQIAVPAPLLITMDAGQLRAGGVGTASGIDEPVAASFLAQAACDAGIQVMLKERGRVIGLGSTARCFTQQQRRAIAARDGTTCLIPGCNIPFPGLEAHHVDPHRRHGPTHVDNGVLLCWWHHHLIDSGIWIVEMHHGIPKVTINARRKFGRAA